MTSRDACQLGHQDPQYYTRITGGMVHLQKFSSSRNLGRRRWRDADVHLGSSFPRGEPPQLHATRELSITLYKTHGDAPLLTQEHTILRLPSNAEQPQQLISLVWSPPGAPCALLACTNAGACWLLTQRPLGRPIQQAETSDTWCMDPVLQLSGHAGGYPQIFLYGARAA